MKKLALAALAAVFVTLVIAQSPYPGFERWGLPWKKKAKGDDIQRFSPCGTAWWKKLKSLDPVVRAWTLLPAQHEIQTYDTDNDGEINFVLVLESVSPMENCTLTAPCETPDRVNTIEFFSEPGHLPIIKKVTWCGGFVFEYGFVKCDDAVICLRIVHKQINGKEGVLLLKIPFE